MAACFRFVNNHKTSRIRSFWTDETKEAISDPNQIQDISTKWYQLSSGVGGVIWACFAVTGYFTVTQSTSKMWVKCEAVLQLRFERAVHKWIPANLNEWKWWCKEMWAKIHPQWCERLIKSHRKEWLQVISAKVVLQATCYWISCWHFICLRLVVVVPHLQLFLAL